MDVFAPRNSAEFARVLHPDGALVVVTPTADHLRDLVQALGLVTVDPEKEDRLERSLGTLFARTRTDSVEAPLVLAAADIATVVAMGPSARHVSPDALRRGIAELGDRIETRIAVRVSVWCRRTG
jgi:23S rRNA (guanine745-N1)-methyltransferase